MATYSLVDSNGDVVNVLLVSGDGLPGDWSIPDGLTLIRQDGGEIGGRWTGSAFEPPPAPAPSAPLTVDQKLASIVAQDSTLELALRAVISLLADQLGRTDAQAKAAVRNRMQEIADGTRG